MSEKTDSKVTDDSIESVLLCSTSFVVIQMMSQIVFNSEQVMLVSFLTKTVNHLVLQYEGDEVSCNIWLHHIQLAILGRVDKPSKVSQP